MMRFVRPFVLLLVLALAWAPVVPAFAVPNPAGRLAPQHDHAIHDHAATGDQVCGHHVHNDACPGQALAADSAQPACDQHDGCQSQCCAGCAHCLNATLVPGLGQPRTIAIQMATVAPAHSVFIPELRNRPPQ